MRVRQGAGGKYLDCGYTLKVESTEFAGGLSVQNKKAPGIQDDSKLLT